MLSCNNVPTPDYKHHSVPRIDRDVNRVMPTNGESTINWYQGKMLQIASEDHRKATIKSAFS